GVRIVERGAAPDHRHVVALELLANDVTLPARDLGDPTEQLLDGRTRGGDRPPARLCGTRRPRDAEGGLAGRLARNGAGVGAEAADEAALLDDRSPIPKLRSLHRRALTGRTASKAEEIEVVRR